MYFALVFLSGFAGLVYEVLWMKQLGLLFGNTAHAAAATLAAFFAGLAAGSWILGKRSATAANPLRIYAWLQVGIAVAALLYFCILRLFYGIYPAVYQSVDSTAVIVSIKFALALLLVFPPAFCMGGTIPVMGQFLVRAPSSFGTTAAMLYGVNTLGAALGACLAGFFFPLWFGFKATVLGAMGVTVAVAATAFLLSRRTMGEKSGTAEFASEAAASAQHRGGRRALAAVCFLSGFGILALEVLWMRMFAQVLENSVYTFAAILVIVLVCLAAGAFVSSRLARMALPSRYVLVSLVLAGGIAVSLTPFVFMRLTDSLQILVSRGSWPEYLGLIFQKGFLTIGPPALLLGTVFPYLMKVEEGHARSAGASLGRLSAINTAGAILGSLLCGFLFLELWGMWRTMQLIAVVYLTAALILPLGWASWGIALKAIAGIFLLMQFSALNPAELPINSVDALRPHQQIIETWEGSDCTVAVARDRHGLSIKINSHYGLGSTGAIMQQKLQADMPLMMHPDTESIFFLGTGTGVTAGSALDPQFPNVKRVVTCELVPEVITAARRYMTNINGFDCTGGLFSDPRATVLVEDGRHYLMASGETFDMINADLFVPFRSGAGSLYSREHFECVKQRLEPDGIFVQWLPLYQVTENEFSIVARTMLEVFDQVSLWRSTFQPGDEVVALVGHPDSSPLPSCTLDSSEDKRIAIAGKDHRDLGRLQLPFNPQTILFFYCGNLAEARELFAKYPVNSDDRPYIEYMAPRTYRDETDAAVPWFVGPRLARLVEELQRRCPADGDPLLVNRTPASRRLPAAGVAFHRARLWDVIGDEEACKEAWGRFVKEWTGDGG